MITIEPYNAAWPAMFEAEAAGLRGVLGMRALRIEHVGSTAVPGLAAKPVIDIQVSVQSLEPRDRHAELLGQLGYLHVPLGTFDRVYPFFQKPARWPSTHHVHLCVVGSRQEYEHLAFRDCLRKHAELAAAYLTLKQELAAAHHADTLESRERYSLAKSEFVRSVLERAPKQRPRIRLSRNGPCLVTVDDLTNSKGERLEGRHGVALCRCGASSRKPFCDSSHIRIGFSDEPRPGAAVLVHPPGPGDVNAPSIRIARNGPYEVQGFDLDTEAWSEGVSRDRFALCRCGGSKNKPFCDGTHRSIGFQDDGN